MVRSVVVELLVIYRDSWVNLKTGVLFQYEYFGIKLL